ncbi:MAG: phosphatidate phosphatase App1 family protein, partial [Marinicella sp.]
MISGPVSELKDDESVVFFKTSAWLNQQTNQWHVPIHGWIFEHEDSTVRKGLIAAAMDTGYELKVTAKTKSNFNQRVNWLLVDNERRKSMVIRLAGRTYAIPDSEANGHFSTVLTIDSEILNAAGIESQLSYQAVLSDLDQREFNGLVQLVDPAGLSIISDIDDTIKISEVTDRKQLLDHTFFKDFTAVPGMATLYQKLLQNEGALHFVSSSPWQLYPELEKFISKAQFPDADYALKSFRFKDSSLMNLFASSLETKPPQIIEIIKRYPNRKFI